ncbi:MULTISPECIES: DNA topoisomerase [unclassified Bilifractor]|uniref:DNA topoisomerase n=1 Tax=unclassified Bilifractor TaxID=2815795 RepID=UPI003F8EA58E
MPKSLYIAEKPSVAQEFAKALHENPVRHDGYMESDNSVVTWCVGHLVTMSYPDKYDEKYKKWSFDTLPFLPAQFRYEVISSVRKQFQIVSGLLNREDVETIYVCTDSGREGEYIYRLVAMMAKVPPTRDQRRVWIDSQTEEEILRGIREAKNISEYDNLSEAAFLRAKEDYLMGINFSRALSLRYSYDLSSYLGGKYHAIAVGRVMTCVLGMVVRREREIRDFVKTPFFRVLASLSWQGRSFEGEWKAVEGSRSFQSPKLYKENGFRKKEDAEELIQYLGGIHPQEMKAVRVEKKTARKNPPLLYNLAEIQNDCSRFFKISPDQTLNIIQELYEKKLVTYPRTDARVLSTAIAKEINRNIGGLRNYAPAASFASEILEKGTWKGIGKTRYTNDKQITDHYAIIPTGQGLQNLKNLTPLAGKVYDLIVRRFLSIFYPPAVYQKVSLETQIETEHFFSNFSVLTEEGYLKLAYRNPAKKTNASADDSGESSPPDNAEEQVDTGFLEALKQLHKGSVLPVSGYKIREGETSPPKRYTSGSMILAMENAGQLIEDEELREQIKGSGIGTSATRAEILKKLFNNKYLELNKKTQVITPTQIGEMIHDVVYCSIRSLLNPELTASWEKGLTYVAEGTIEPSEYLNKLETFVANRTNAVKQTNNRAILQKRYDYISQFYKKGRRKKS